MALDFLDLSANRRLAMFTKVLSLIGSSVDDPKDIYVALLELMRQTFDQRCYVEVTTKGLKTGSYRITRIWREDGHDAVPDHSPWRGEGVPVRQGGVIADLLARSEPGAVNRVEFEPEDPAWEELGLYHSVAMAPGGMGEWHNWVLVFDRRANAFTPDDVEVLVLRVNLVGLSLKNLGMLGELRKAQRDIDQEVDRIAEIQKSLLPPDRPAVPGLEIAARSETFDRAGGDIYDYAVLPDGRWSLLVADASGHGPSAAVVISMLNAILHTLAMQQTIAPANALRLANIQLANKRIDQSFVTALIAIWDPKTRLFTYARAGHHPPLVRRRGEVMQLKAVGNLPLGIFDDAEYQEHPEPLQSGDVIVMYTDGVTEAVNQSGELFGDERLIETLCAAGERPEEILDNIWNTFSAFQAGGTPRDDQTLMVIRVK
jgi:sigma-B regulation protein RsbU (phosphoserine phosphatase)